MPRSASSWTSELNGVPGGLRPMRFHSSSPSNWNASVQANSFEMLWIEKVVAASLTLNTSPAIVTIAMPKLPGGTNASSGI